MLAPSTIFSTVPARVTLLRLPPQRIAAMLGAIGGGAALKRSASTDRLAGGGAPACAATAQAAACPPAGTRKQQRRLALRFRGYRMGVGVPNELWGAAALAARLAQPGGNAATLLPPLPRAASVIAQVSKRELPDAYFRFQC